MVQFCPSGQLPIIKFNLNVYLVKHRRNFYYLITSSMTVQNVINYIKPCRSALVLQDGGAILCGKRDCPRGGWGEGKGKVTLLFFNSTSVS